ncbi:MAG TPA: acylphosphatase [Dehalococcoidia bacterium]|nr:acylphosphatase [Dehalococcoidia bacterium]
MSNSALASFHAIAYGQVQGVFFRAFVQDHANALGLTGYARNLAQSRAVEVQAEGKREKLEKLVELLHRGPSGARVETVEVKWGGYSGDFSSFTIRY